MNQTDVEGLLDKARAAERILYGIDSSFRLGYLVEHTLAISNNQLPWDKGMQEQVFSGLEKAVFDLRDDLAGAIKAKDEKAAVRPLAILVRKGYWHTKVDFEMVNEHLDVMEDMAEGYLNLGCKEAQTALNYLKYAEGKGRSYSGELSITTIIGDLLGGEHSGVCTSGREADPAGLNIARIRRKRSNKRLTSAGMAGLFNTLNGAVSGYISKSVEVNGRYLPLQNNKL